MTEKHFCRQKCNSLMLLSCQNQTQQLRYKNSSINSIKMAKMLDKLKNDKYYNQTNKQKL